MSTLYLIATPIGNLEDISARAVRLLREARLIAAEDTRHTKKLLAHYDIHTQLTSYYEHNKLGKIDVILAELEKGDVAVVSDAGTPGLNDPGYELVQAVLQAGHQVSPVPGACAPIAALVASGLPTDRFLYLGYLPRRQGERRRFLQEIAGQAFTLVFLEVPHRLAASLDDLLAVLGNRQISIARELTKLHEEIFRGPVDQARQHFAIHEPRGEITLVVAGASGASNRWSELEVDKQLKSSLENGEPPSQAAARLSAISGWPRREIYQRLMDTKNTIRPTHPERNKP
jgi:16S rRNA (cytidine1402-2'-O)-methyltransferase